LWKTFRQQLAKIDNGFARGHAPKLA
jgi:hypothetical protein